MQFLLAPTRNLPSPLCAIRGTPIAVPTTVPATQAHVTYVSGFSGLMKLRLKEAETTGSPAWRQVGRMRSPAEHQKGSEKVRHRYSWATVRLTSMEMPTDRSSLFPQDKKWSS